MKPLQKYSIVAFGILALAVLLRFPELALRPYHHDEGVNGFFLTRLLREGAFKYDPGNYHGPTLYYLTLPVVAILGLSDEALRGTTAAFGTLTVFLLWRFLAPWAPMMGLSAMALLATSPGAVFYSRYFIHEALFLAFTLGSLAAAPHREGRKRWRFLAAGLSLGLLFATKETAFVSVGAMVAGAIAAAWLVEGWSPWSILKKVRPYMREHAENLMHGALVFAASAGLLYSSFFQNPRGVLDAFRTFAFWTKTAVRDHDNPWNQHFLWLAEADPVLLYLGFAGLLLALLLRRSFIAVMASVWVLLLFFAYSVVKYKTPWLGLNMLLPLAITSGYLIHEIWKVSLLSGRLSFKPLAVLLLVAAAGLSTTKSRNLEMKTYDDETHPYIYAHTQRSFLEFVRLVEARAATHSGKNTGIAVFAPENWPLAWYLRDYSKTGYWGEFKNEVEVEMYVVAASQDSQMAIKGGGRYERLGPYNLRGAVDLILYTRTPEAPLPATSPKP